MPRPTASPNSGPPAGRKRCTKDGCRKLAPKGRKRCDDHGPKPKTTAKPKLLGCTEPRLFTPPLRPLTRHTSKGFEVIDFAAMIGEPLLPWQERAVIRALELMPDGTFRFKTILILVARQNGKSAMKRIISLWRMYMEAPCNIFGVAQDVALAREQFNMAQDTIHGCPDMEAEWGGASRRTGDEWFGLTNGSRYKITAANGKAGRGYSIDEVNIDELRTQYDWDAWSALYYTTMAKAGAQIWAMSNMGDDRSVVLNMLRESALSGRDKTIGLFEWSAPDGCELDDRAAWQQANPALGYLISESGIASAKESSPPNVFRTEVLCQKVDQLDGAIDLPSWKDCADPAGTMDGLRDRIAACFDVAPESGHCTLAAAALTDDGRVRIEIAGSWQSTDAARAALPELLTEVKPAALGFYPSGPAGAFATMLRPAKNSHQRMEVAELTGGTVAEACQGLADLTLARKIAHSGDPLLDSHIAGAQKLNASDGWRFCRRDAGDCDAAYAAAGAAYMALTMPPPQRARIRILG